VYLSGGGQCYDTNSCQERYNGSGYPHTNCATSTSAAPCFMSSKDYAPTCGKTGLFDADAAHSPLAGAHQVSGGGGGDAHTSLEATFLLANSS
jgi:hypothetical protein